jgi:outer membrane protein assembly factor BamB
MRWHTASDGHLSRSSLLVELDALYFSQDGRELQKISLDDGRRLWRSDAVEGRGAENLTVEREGNSLIVTSDTSVVAVDPVTGLVLWRGTAAPRARFAARQITGAYVVAVDLPADPPVDLPVGVGDDEGEGDATVYCYDHRNASGLIPRDGAPTLRPLDAVHTVLAADGALLFQSQRALQALTHRGP